MCGSNNSVSLASFNVYFVSENVFARHKKEGFVEVLENIAEKAEVRIFELMGVVMEGEDTFLDFKMEDATILVNDAEE